MRLYLLRQKDEIPLDTMKFMAERTAEVLGIDPVVFEKPLKMDVKEADVAGLLKISDSFLERGEPIVGVVFTNENLKKEDVLGEGSERSRGVWVRSTGDPNKTFFVCLHELCHVFEADHCSKRECLMYPFYVPRNPANSALENMLCGSCLQIVKESWVYNRLVSSARSRKNEGRLLPKLVASASETKKAPAPVKEPVISQKETSPVSDKRAFPEWSLPSEEFVNKVKEFFGYED